MHVMLRPLGALWNLALPFVVINGTPAGDSGTGGTSVGTVADWWMVAITVCSVLVSGVLAWLAYRNGAKATQIASEASERDELHRRRELDQRAQAERSAVATAMMRALSAAERFAARGYSEWQTTAAALEKEWVLRKSEALAQIDLYAIDDDDDELHVWFEAAVEAVGAAESDTISQMKLADDVYATRRGIVLWHQRRVTSNMLAVGDLPTEIPR